MASLAQTRHVIDNVISTVRGGKPRGNGSGAPWSEGLVYVPHYTARCKPGALLEAEFGWTSAGQSVFPKNILRGEPACIAFQALHDGLCEIAITFGLHGRKNTCALLLTLTEQEGARSRVVCESTINAHELLENRPYSFRFAPVLHSVSKYYSLTVSSPDAAAANCVAVWGSLIPRTPESTRKILRTESGEVFSAFDSDVLRADLSTDTNEPSSKVFRPFLRTVARSGDLLRIEQGATVPDPTALSAPLFPGRLLEHSFTCGEDGLSAVGIFIDAVQELNACTLIFELRETGSGDAVPLRRSVLSARALAKSDIAWLAFEKIPNSGGKTYTLRLSSDDANADNHVLVLGIIQERGAPEFVPDSAAEIASQNILRRSVELPHEGDRTADIFAPRFTARCAVDGLQFHTCGWGGYHLELLHAALLPGRPLEISFRAPDADLFQLSILTGTHLRENHCTVRLELFEHQDGDRKRCRSVETAGTKIANNTYTDFTFEPIADSKGRWFTALLSSSDATPEQSIAVYGTVLKGDSQPARKLERSPDKQLTAIVEFSRTGPDEERFLRGARTRSNWCVPGFNVEQSAFLVVTGDTLSGDQKSSLNELCEWINACGGSVTFAEADAIHGLVGSLLEHDAVIFFELPWDEKLEPFVRLLRHATIPLIAAIEEKPHERPLDRLGIPLDEPTSPDQPRPIPPKSVIRNRALWEGARRADFFWAPTAEIEHDAERIVKRSVLFDWRHPDSEAAWRELLLSCAAEFRARKFPKFSLVTVLYGKEREIPAVMESYYRQSYLGEYELIFVNDCSPDRSVELVRRFAGERSERGSLPAPKIIMLENPENVGNCGSRNSGLEAATGDVLVVIDADCMLNRDFLEAHAREYADGNPDVVIGYLNIESAGKDPLTAIRDLEEEPEMVPKLAQLQDPVNHASFLNCITRNFSVRRSFVTETLFDELFAYSRKPDSGYGWEDVEMGFRMYLKGATIRFAEAAFSVHISHVSVVEEKTKPLRSLKNFRRLLTKHPEMAVISRRWVEDTYAKLSHWCDSYKLPPNDDRLALDHQLLPYSNLLLKTSRRKLRVLTYRWHAAHQYELYRLGHDFTLARFPWPSFTNSWSYEERPFPDNAKFVDLDRIRFSDYDLAILHFDENVLATDNCNGVLRDDWGAGFRWFLANVPLPKIGVCHGTPQFRGQYDFHYSAPDLGSFIEDERKRLVDAVGDMPVVVNSHQAEREWGFSDSRVIWHGFDPAEYQLSSYRDGVLSIGRPMKSRPHYRGYFLAERIAQSLPADLKIHSLAVEEPDAAYLPDENAFAVQKFENYRKNIRQYSVYFNPTIHSPMPRSRTEAMLCGLATVSVNNHDVEQFVRNGGNGFYSNDADELADYLRFLHRHPEAVRTIGAAGRKTAQDLFNHDRYLARWQKTLGELTGETV